MSPQYKNEMNRECDQNSPWRRRAYCDEGTEVDLRWGFKATNFGVAATLEITEPEERLLAQVSGKSYRMQSADRVESAAVHSTNRRAAIDARS